MKQQKNIKLDQLNKQAVDKLVEGLEKEDKGYQGTCSFAAMDDYQLPEK